MGRVVIELGLFCSFLCSVALLIQVLGTDGLTIHYAMGGWDAPLGIEFVVDTLNALFVVFITLIAFLTSIYGIRFRSERNWIQTAGLGSLIGLLAMGLCGMSLTGDVFNLYVFLEVSSLSCYGLVAIGGKKSIISAFRYLLIGTIGASFYLIGVGTLYSMTGTLNMADLRIQLQGKMDTPLMALVCVCLIAAFGIKMSIFPFHVWQPDAYSYAYPGASPLISGVMSKVPAFAMIRFLYFIFGIDNLVVHNSATIVGIFGAIGMIFGSIIAFGQSDFRRMLAYSSIAQLGYIALGIGIGDYYGLAGSYLHILNHILMKGGLFFVIGAIQYRYGIVDIHKFGQLHKKMPITCFALVVCSLSMIGIPPTGGFFSKWYLMLGSMQNQEYIYVAVLVVSTLLNAFYFLRVIEHIFISKDSKLEEKTEIKGRLELPIKMLLPIILFAIGVLAMGFLNGTIMTNIVEPILQGVV